MIKFAFSLAALVALVALVALANARSPEIICFPHSKFYDDLGCTAVKDLATGCSARFECPEIPKDEMCHFNGKTYFQGQNLIEKDQPACLRSCVCALDYPESSVNTKFVCAPVECPHQTFMHDPPNCVRTYPEGSGCCGTQVCDEEKVKEFRRVKCIANGKEYNNGQSFSMGHDECQTCTCSEGFDESIPADENPRCQKINCNTRLVHMDKLHKGCVPIYEKNVCCPVDWVCPTGKDEVNHVGSRQEGVDPLEQCKFGTETLNPGDDLVTANEDVRCSCRYPPLVTCEKKN